MKLKHYLVFEYPDYYPSGGWNDFIGDFDTIEEARAACKDPYGGYDIIDIETGERE